MKTVTNPTIFVKNAKKNRKMISFGNFCWFFEIFTETLEQNIRKSHKKFFFRWKRRQINKNEQFSNFWENQFYRKAIAFDKIGGNYALSANSIRICLLGYFCMQNSYLRWKPFKILRFSWKMQKNSIMISFGNFLLFFLQIFTETLEQNIKQFKIQRFSWKMQKKKKKKIEKWLVLVIFVNCFEIFTETLEQNIRKSHKICCLDG